MSGLDILLLPRRPFFCCGGGVFCLFMGENGPTCSCLNDLVKLGAKDFVLCRRRRCIISPQILCGSIAQAEISPWRNRKSSDAIRRTGRTADSSQVDQFHGAAANGVGNIFAKGTRAPGGSFHMQMTSPSSAGRMWRV